MKRTLLMLALCATARAQVFLPPPAGGGTGDALTTNPLSQFAATTSSQFKGVISDENAPDGASSKVILALGSLSIASGKTATFSNSLTFTGTDASSIAFGTGGTALMSGGAYGTPSSETLTNATGLPESGVTNLTSDLALKATLASPTFTGTVTLPSGQALVAPALGTPASGTLTNETGLPIATGVSGLGTGIATALAVNTGSAGAPALLYSLASGTMPTTPAIGQPFVCYKTGLSMLAGGSGATIMAVALPAGASGYKCMATWIEVTAVTAGSAAAFRFNLASGAGVLTGSTASTSTAPAVGQTWETGSTSPTFKATSGNITITITTPFTGTTVTGTCYMLGVFVP